MLLSLLGCSLAADRIRHDQHLAVLAEQLRAELPRSSVVHASVEGPYSSNGCHLLAWATVTEPVSAEGVSMAWVERDEIVVRRGQRVERQSLDCRTCWTPGLRERLMEHPGARLAFVSEHLAAGSDWRCR